MAQSPVPALRARHTRARLLFFALAALACATGCDGCQKKQVPVTSAPTLAL